MRNNNGTSTDLNPIPKSIRKLWDVWDLRVCILVSLGLQTFLILFASWRKRTASRKLITLIWLAYLLADWIAAFVLGLIANSKDDSSGSEEKLQAFWAPFLLLHLGGPDTITAFALEDNELWLRHLLGLIFQFAAAAYIFFQTLPYNDLWGPTVLMFLAGLIKYAERTNALFLASLGSFRDSMLKDPDPGPNYAKLMAEYSSMEDAHLPVKIEKIPEPETSTDANDDPKVKEIEIDDREKVKQAYKFFQTFKGLIVDLIFSFHDRSTSRDFFLERNTKDAFKVIEIELSFIYEVLYTKVVVIHSLRGYFLRGICFISTLTALLLFVSYKKNELKEFDIITTYLLLIGAIVLDFIALLMLVLSDWSITAEKDSTITSGISWILTKLSLFNLCRWSECLAQFNLISFCLSKRSKLIDSFVDHWGLKDLLDEINFKSFKPVHLKLKDFIFNDLKNKSSIAKEPKHAKEICSARGGWILGRSFLHNNRSFVRSVEVEYDESLLLWHIATEIAYQKKEGVAAKDRKTVKINRCFAKLVSVFGSAKIGHKKVEVASETAKDNDRLFSKLLSDYMFYLLVMQPTMMSAVAGIGLIRYRDTCAEAKIFFSRLEADNPKVACEKLIGVNTVIKPADVKGDRSKSVLFDAVILAKDLDKIPEDKRWKLMSQVWMELLCYAASNCRASSHAQQLSKGGELLTFVWLLMTHLGLGEQFRIETGHARAKLIVEK